MKEHGGQQVKISSMKDEQQKTDSLQARAEAASSAMNVAYKVAAGIGALTTFGYLLLIGFFPSGLTPGEVIFFVFIALAFAFTYAVILIYGAFASIWFAHLLSSIAKFPRFSEQRLQHELFPPLGVEVSSPAAKDHALAGVLQVWRNIRFAASRATLDKRSLVPSIARGWLLGLMSFMVFVLFAATALEIRSTQFTEFFIGCIAAGFLVVMFLEPPSLSKQYRQATVSRAVGIGIAPLLVVSIYTGPAPLLNIVFEGLGIRARGVSLELEASEIGSIERIQELIDRPLLDCRRPQPNKLLVHGADILWTGVGDQTLVQFGPDKIPERRLFSPQQKINSVGTIKLDTKSIRIIKTVPRINPCFDLSSDLLFDTGKYAFAPHAAMRMKGVADSITKFGKPKRIVVRGHSDPRRILTSTDGSKTDNQQLSERRAAAVANALKTLLNDSKVEIVSEGAGSRELRLRCQQNANISSYEVDQCNKPNRRVEVRVTYSR